MDNQRSQEERERLDHLPCPERDSRGAPVGVLLSDEIKYYASAFDMIKPFDEERLLKAAGYELTVGDEYVLEGERKELMKDGEIRIPSFSVVVIKTSETINLPRFLIARWNIRVKWAYEGLLWVGGPQVDPGWVGHLFCPLYNLSDKEVVLRYGDPIALMDFVTTTPFKPGQSISYPRPPKRVLLEEYRAAYLKSALYSQAKQRIGQIEEDTKAQIDSVNKRFEFFFGSGLVILTLLFAVLAVFVTFGRETIIPVWPFISLPTSIIAFVLALRAWVNSRRRK
jgi:deoxycytidine triphosphate deaminase